MDNLAYLVCPGGLWYKLPKHLMHRAVHKLIDEGKYKSTDYFYIVDSLEGVILWLRRN